MMMAAPSPAPLAEALTHGGIANNCRVNLKHISAEEVDREARKACRYSDVGNRALAFYLAIHRVLKQDSAEDAVATE